MQSFILPANGKATPDSIARKRKMAEAMLANGMDASPIASPWQGAARMAQALVGGLGSRRADSAEAAGQQSAKDAMIKALTGGGKSDLIDAASNPFMSNAGMSMVGNQWEKMNAPPPNPELKAMDNGQFYQYDPRDPQGSGQAFTPDGYNAPPGTRLITGEEATKMGLPPGAYNMDAGGKISQIGGNDTNVNINNADPNQPMMGTIPPGYAAVRDPQSPSGFRLEMIGGGPAANEAALLQEKDAATKATAAEAGDIVTTDISRALDKMHNSTLPTSGFIGSLTKDIPGFDSHDVSKLLETISGNVGFDRLQQMRNNSPTGGALGAINKTEMDLLQAVKGNLAQSQSTQQLEYNLKRLNNIYLDIIHGPGKGPTRMDLTAGGAPDQGGNSELEDALKKYGQ